LSAAMEVAEAEAELAQRQSQGEAAALEEAADEAAAAEADPAAMAADAAAAAAKTMKALEAQDRATSRELLRFDALLKHSRQYPTGSTVFVIYRRPTGEVELGESARHLLAACVGVRAGF